MAGIPEQTAGNKHDPCMAHHRSAHSHHGSQRFEIPGGAFYNQHRLGNPPGYGGRWYCKYIMDGDAGPAGDDCHTGRRRGSGLAALDGSKPDPHPNYDALQVPGVDARSDHLGHFKNLTGSGLASWSLRTRAASTFARCTNYNDCGTWHHQAPSFNGNDYSPGDSPWNMEF